MGNANRLLGRIRGQSRRYWWAGVERLDRPGRRWLLPIPASVWLSISQRTPCLVYPSRGTWIHRYRGASIPHATLGRAAPPDAFTAEARDIFLHAYMPRAGDTVVDVGAGIGTEALLFSRLVGPEGRVVSLEAHPRTYERLAELCVVNRLDNVIPVQAAAADVDGEITISDGAHHLQNTVVTGDEGIRVPARRLDSVARELGVDRVDFLKMNIEGAERLALEGARNLLASTQHVCISCHDFLADAGAPEAMRTKEHVRALLVRAGFEVASRDGAAEPWTRDYVYGTRANRK